MKTRGFRVAVIVLSCAFAAVFLPVPASADSAPTGGDLHIAQTLGDRDLTVVIRRVDGVPGPLPVEVVTHAGTAPGTLGLRAFPVEGDGNSTASLVLGVLPGSYPATLSVDRPGPWELAIDDGREVARIPFVVPARVVPPWEKAAYGGFVAAGLFLLVALVTALRARRTWLTLVPGAGVVAAVAVGITAAVLSASTPPPPQPGPQLDPTGADVADPYAIVSSLSTMDFSRPPVNLVVTSDAVAGASGEVELAFTDGSTGRGVDDLLVHDNAFVHLVIIGPSGELWHLHPVRVAAGRYRVRLNPPEPGEYAVAAEIARRGGGVQLVRARLDVRPGGRSVFPATVQAEVRTTVAGAGSPSTITAHFTGPADLQPWLGMLGHLIAVGPLPGDADLGTAALAAPVWAHAHAMFPATPGAVGGQPDETVAAYGPDVSFTYTFPLPGRYRLWIQAERGYAVLTVPVTVEVLQKGAGE
ncbi:hypothetical protein [Amycolatopsis pigmentata]|uniref:Secreted protein n=1 Tax=Amycolatopsis pigmentata TaxID=450801 RepID=A0ABW5FRL7_9PSEU